jgi:hypothetical protein
MPETPLQGLGIPPGEAIDLLPRVKLWRYLAEVLDGEVWIAGE